MSLPVPLVFVTSGDPVVAGLASSLARPKPGITGITFMAAEMNGKRLELLREFVPSMRRLAVIANPEHPGAAIELDFAREKASGLGLTIDLYETRSRDELDRALAAIAAKPVEAFSVFADGFALQNRGRIIGAATAMRVPVTSGWLAFAQSGALLTYGPRLSASYRRLANYIVRIIGGARPENLPIEQPATFELVVNLTTARKLGIPDALPVLARADTIIDG